MKKVSRQVNWIWLIAVIFPWSVICAQADQRKAVSSGSEIDTSRLEELIRELQRREEEHKRRDELWKKDPKEYMRRYVFPKLVPVDDEFLSKLPRIRERITAEAAKRAKEGEREKAPENMEEAWRWLQQKVRFEWCPTKYLEYEGVYYFSGGNSAGPVYDFSWGYAIRKGDPTIYEWRLPEFNHPLTREEDWSGSESRDIMRTLSLEERGNRFSDPKIVSVDGDFLSKLPRIKEHLTISRVMRGVQSWEEASWLLLNSVSMACFPTKCVEHEGVFYFSGGTSAKWIDDFSSGFAIPKGKREIYEWYLRESNNKGDGEGSRK